MLKSSTGSAGVVVMVLLMGVLLALASLVSLIGLNEGGRAAIDALLGNGDASGLQSQINELWTRSPAGLIVSPAGPVLMAILAAILVRTGASAPAGPDSQEESAPAGPPQEIGALRLLALLQQEARFIDFITEDIQDYDDAQVGAAVREIHADCRKTLSNRIKLMRIYENDDGTELTVDEGFDPAEVRLTGNITGDPPFKGTLQHGGWRAVKVTLPESPGDTDPYIIAPAEVEIA